MIVLAPVTALRAGSDRLELKLIKRTAQIIVALHQTQDALFEAVAAFTEDIVTVVALLAAVLAVHLFAHATTLHSLSNAPAADAALWERANLGLGDR